MNLNDLAVKHSSIRTVPDAKLNMNHNDLVVNWSSNRTVPDAKLTIKKLCKQTPLEFK